MGTTNPENGSTTPSEPTPDLTDLLVIYHQHLIDQSRLNRTGDAVDTPRAVDVDSSLDDSLVEDPGLAEELAQLEDCLWQLEQLRRDEQPPPTLDLATSPTPANASAFSAGSIRVEARTLGRFKILRELGRGGLGIVFLAHDPVLNRHVALKIPRSESLLTPELHQRFQREAQAAARLTHPNIVPVFEIGEAGPILYIASAYVAGQSLAEWLRAQTAPVPVATAARIVASLADAMHYAHAQGVLHRDLKPANVLLEPAPGKTSSSDEDEYQLTEGKIADFGLAKLLDLAGTETRSNAIVGTPAYMSPEQAEAKQAEIGPATDIFSLGAILHELLVGRPPYRGESDAATLLKVMQGQISDMRKTRPEITADLQAICLKCLERDPASRYASAGELAADLRRYLRGESTVARPLASWQRLGRWTKRNPIVAALSFVSLALLLSVAIVSSVAALRIRTARDEAQQTALAEAAARQRADKALLAEQAALAEAQAEKQRTAEARDAADQQAANATQISNMLTELFTTADPLGIARLGFRSADEVGMDLPLSELLRRGAKHARQSLVDQPLVQATLLDTLGTVYSNLGQLAEAEPLLREAYELRQNNGASEAELLTSKLHVGNLLRWQGEHVKAEPMLREVLAGRERLLGPEDLGVAEAKFALAWALFERAMLWKLIPGHTLQTNEASILIEQALRIQFKVLGPDHRDVGLTMSAAAVARWNLGDTEGAKQAMLDAINVLSRQEGGERLLLAMSDVAQGTIARRNRDLASAIDFYRKALPPARESLGQNHFLNVMLMGELAGTLADDGRMAEAEVVIRDGLQTAFKIFPQGHPMLLESLNGLASIVESRGEYAEAEALIRQSREIEKRWASTPPEYEHLGIVLLQVNSGQYAEVLDLLSRHRLNPRDSLLAKFFLANVVRRFDLAESLLRHMLNNGEQYDSEPSDYSRTALELAIFINEHRQDDPEAMHLISKNWDPKTMSQLSPRYPERCFWHLVISKILIQHQRYAEVASDVERILEFLRTKSLPGNWFIGYAEYVAGQLRDAQGRDEEAEALLLSGLANLRKSRGEVHSYTREVAGALVKFYQQHDRAAEAVAFEPLLKMPEPIEIDLKLLEP